LHTWQRNAANARIFDDGVSQRMLRAPFHRSRKPQRIIVHSRANHARPAFGQRSGLVQNNRVHAPQLLERFSTFDEQASFCPASPARPANPIAHGQAMIKTATAAAAACVNPPPATIQIENVSIEIASTDGTKIELILSANFSIGARED